MMDEARRHSEEQRQASLKRAGRVVKCELAPSSACSCDWATTTDDMSTRWKTNAVFARPHGVSAFRFSCST